MAPIDHYDKNEIGESAPLLQQTNTSSTSSQQPRVNNPSDSAAAFASMSQQQQQQQQQQQNNAMAAAGYFLPPPGYYPPPTGTGTSTGRYSPQQHQSPNIVYSPNQSSHKVIGAAPGTTAGVPPQPPFFYPFPPQQPNGNSGAPYPYQPPPPPMYQAQQQQRQQQQYHPSLSSSKSSRPELHVGSINNDSAQWIAAETSNSGGIPNNMTIANNKTSSGLPPLDEIFDGSNGRESQPILGNQQIDNIPTTNNTTPPPNSGGYGSIGTTPQIYNAPNQSRRLPPSGRAPQQPLNIKRGTSTSGSSQKNNKNHRRVHSVPDNPLRVNRAHRRAGSGEVLLPPREVGAGHNRSRTLSGGNPLKPRHRRGNSSNSNYSMTGDSFVVGSIADSSMVSMRSNIAKSTLFGGVDEKGRPIMYYPYEDIRVLMIPKQDLNNDDSVEQERHLPLTIGHLYSDLPINMEDYYEDYHQISDNFGTPQWESLDVHPILRKSGKSKHGKGKKLQGGERPNSICGCQCTNCHACLGKQDLLPPTNYIVAVSDDIYRRMFSEVADSQSMPCGLFYCGHYEDVDYPSVWIPGILVIILFGAMFYFSCQTGLVSS